MYCKVSIRIVKQMKKRINMKCPKCKSNVHLLTDVNDKSNINTFQCLKCYHIFKKNTDKDVQTARRCLEFQNFHCDNMGCLNENCPLHRSHKIYYE